MKRFIVALTGAGMLVAGLSVVPAHASSQTDAVEVRILQLINQGRGGSGKAAEVMHAGLRLAAQQHSADMSARNTMDHTGYPARVNNANPDPVESNGPPDDGFTGASCENVAWFQPGSTSMSTDQIAQQFYTMWFNSAHHHDCMFDVWNYGLNAAGVGIYYAGGKWWATFDSATDRTLPSGTTPPPSSTWTRIQQNQAGVTRTGTWYSIASSSASGGSYMRSNTTGNSATFTFTGTAVKWIGISSTTGGIANVSLDNGTAVAVDQYSSSAQFGRMMFQRTGLAAGRHTLRITVSGKKNVSATAAHTFIDAFDYLS